MPAVIRISAEGDIATGAVNVFHSLIPNSAPVTEANNAIGALNTMYGTLATWLQMGQITIGKRVVTVDQNPDLVIGATSQIVASTGASFDPLNCAAVISWGTQVVGGSRRGRTYLGPLEAGGVSSDGRTIASAMRTAILSAATAMAGTTTGGIQFGIWSRKLQTFTAVNSITVNPLVGTQRRRLT